MKIINKKNLSIDLMISDYLVDYKIAMQFMEERVNSIVKEEKNEAIWFLEHPSLYTAGRAHQIEKSHIKNTPIYNTGRGGKTTWHGPGQRIIYFMINIRKRKYDIREFVYKLEDFIIKSLKDLNIKAFKRKKLIGIWTKDQKNNDAKIASLGLRVSKGIIYHGISININCDLSYFKKIDVCGIKNSHVTSISSIKSNITINQIDEILVKNISQIFT
ncbi:MAG: Octanoyltransferase [Alphaproteobacteria bacterium MarineAlpha9_Bin4]|nr:lipoate-protein ligase B [Pelagibacterales bacterium]PPR27116.1 MAG: Octanoyltransferase [Alphaproteobacteria bacterium MarineAlpha9_Bin4]|tara:strand:- start:655 stop:1302 length:648 start_codon:yes stop_codon:yes gene_type:complete